MAYADSEERSWTEKAMDIGREIKYSVETFFDDISYNVYDHYDGLIKGADHWYILGQDVAHDNGYKEGYIICYDQSFRSHDDGYSKGYAKGRNDNDNDNEFNDNLSADDGEKYHHCINTDYKEGYSEGYSDGWHGY